MTEESVVLKALKIHQRKLDRDFKKVDALMNEDHLRPLMAVRSEFHSMMNSGKRDTKTLDRIGALVKKEKQLEASFKKSCSMRTNDRWVKLSLELEEINCAIAREERKQGGRSLC